MSAIWIWFRNYNTEITWFIIGLLISNVMLHIGQGQYGLALIDGVLAGVNYYFWKARS